MNTACPTDDRLKQLIKEAFSESAFPDPARLQHIESRLTNKLSRNKDGMKPAVFRWLTWLFLAASASAAAWWGSHYFTEEADPVNPIITSQPVVPHTNVINEQPPTGDNNTESTEQAPSTIQNSPIIDKRERY